jgi:hypothetical protein
MSKRQNVFCALGVCIAVFILVAEVSGQQKRRRGIKSTETVKTNVLSRSRAAELIKAYPDFKTTYNSKKIPMGRFWYDVRNIRDPLFNDLRPLEEQGILIINETGEMRTSWWQVYLVELTSDGEVQAKAWMKTSEKTKGETEIMPDSPEGVVFRIPLATRELVEVTGIAFAPGDKAARVEFTWRWVPTAQAKLLPKKVPSNEPHTQAFYFQLYDDGWRITGQEGMRINELNP